MFNYVKEIDGDTVSKRKLLKYLQQLANADSVFLDMPDESDDGKSGDK